MSEDPFAVFRPVRGRTVAIVFGTLAVVGFTLGGMFFPMASWNAPDRLLFACIGYAVGALFYRYATIRAVPTRDGLTVRNLVLTRTVAWPQVVAIRFPEGAPWVHLDLSDADTMAVMAIQRADGPRAQREASRMAALIQALGTAAEPDRRD